jgi:hypothetical protein
MKSDHVYKRMLAKARRTNVKRSKMEREAGLAPPNSTDLATLLRTATAALECAVKTEDWQTVCEGAVFIEQAIARALRGVDR